MVVIISKSNLLDSLNISDKDKIFLREVLISLSEEDFKNGDYYQKVCEHINREKSSLRKRIKKIINEVSSSGTLNVCENIKGKDFVKMLKESER